MGGEPERVVIGSESPNTESESESQSDTSDSSNSPNTSDSADSSSEKEELLLNNNNNNIKNLIKIKQKELEEIGEKIKKKYEFFEIQFDTNKKTGKYHGIKCLKFKKSNRSKKRLYCNICNDKDQYKDQILCYYFDLFNEIADLQGEAKY
ncbi:bromodomain testis-specific protein [Anaeramoeba flamelloides]|uniref:Bromodomain testis-specific protein n=1 Tax=Anaeramoeba flamelloides TaxID=1746091 RepID=A0AAV7ZV43_9EUKA|nr:bromodomain testis-specific protein [Anaeramoeba flamelloides]